MSVSAFSVLTAVVWFNLAILLVAVLRPKSAFLMRHGASVLLVLFLLGVVRVFLPLDFGFSYVVESGYVMPAIQRFLCAELIPGRPYLTPGTALLCVWLAGCCAALYRAARRMWREKGYRDGFHTSPSPQAERVLAGMGARNVSVYVVEELSVPIVFGVFRAHIYLPRMELSDAELEMILTHELRHVKSHDTLIKLFYLALCVIFWWNPMVSVFRDELDRLLELRCDAGVVKSLGDEEKKAYLSSILSVMKQAVAPGVRQARPLDARAFAGSSGLFSGGSDAFLKQRFELVLEKQEKPKWAQMATLSVLVAAFLLSYLVIVQPVSEPPAEEAGVVITPDNSYILIKDDVWKLYVDKEYFGTLSIAERSVNVFSQLPKYEVGVET